MDCDEFPHGSRVRKKHWDHRVGHTWAYGTVVDDQEVVCPECNGWGNRPSYPGRDPDVITCPFCDGKKLVKVHRVMNSWGMGVVITVRWDTRDDGATRERASELEEVSIVDQLAALSSRQNNGDGGGPDLVGNFPEQP